MLTQIQSFFQPWFILLADDPTLRLLQSGMVLGGSLVIFLVFYATRDILLRTHSFFYMFFSIALVAGLPAIGFLLYLLIRPPRTIKERELEEMLRELTRERGAPPAIKKPKPKTSKKSKPSEDISL